MRKSGILGVGINDADPAYKEEIERRYNYWLKRFDLL